MSSYEDVADIDTDLVNALAFIEEYTRTNEDLLNVVDHLLSNPELLERTAIKAMVAQLHSLIVR